MDAGLQLPGWVPLLPVLPDELCLLAALESRVPIELLTVPTLDPLVLLA